MDLSVFVEMTPQEKFEMASDLMKFKTDNRRIFCHYTDSDEGKICHKYDKISELYIRYYVNTEEILEISLKTPEEYLDIYLSRHTC